ncbi:MAG: InlB B-repeat-containing protein, partial [Caldisericum sp.]
YVTQSGILFTATNNKSVAIDINTGDIVATYDLPSKSEYVFLLTVGYDPNVAWYATVVGSEINVYKLRLTSQEIKTYTIKASAQTNGVIKPSGNVVVNEGDTRNFLIIPNPGYKIKDVLVDGKSVGAVNAYTFENITSDHTIEAQFEPITFTITSSSSLGGTISPSGTITVNYGDSKTFNITPNPGYKIK